MLAIAVTHSTWMQADPPPSRASSLPQGFEPTQRYRLHEHPLRRTPRRPLAQGGQTGAASSLAGTGSRPGHPASGGRSQALRMRWPVGLPHHAPAGGTAQASRAGASAAQALPWAECAGGRQGCRDRPVRRRPAPGKRRVAGDGAVQPDPAHRPRRPHRHAFSPVCATWRSPRRRRRSACITRRIPRRRSPVPSAATSRKMPAACTASSTV